MPIRLCTFPEILTNPRLLRGIALAPLGLWLSACVSSPASRVAKLEVEVPDDWSATAEASDDYVGDAWLADLDDPRLMGIIEEALAYNHDLKAAAARLDAALATTVANRADFWPSLGVSGTGNRTRRSQASGVSQTSFNESFGLTARLNWEIDLWGKVRNGYRAELADAEAAWADYQAAKLSLTARVAKAWYAAVEANEQFELEKRILEALTESSQIVEENFASGIAGALDVRLIRANLASSKSSLEQRRRTKDATTRTLETLLGRYPKSEIEIATGFPEIPVGIEAGLPSDLLLRRPDVLAAERRLAAAEQRKFETSKARLPSFDLSLSRGTSASEVDGIFEFIENRIWSQSLTIAQTLFQGGRLRANYQRSKAQYEQSVETYAQTVLTAFREVEIALANQDSYAADYEALKVAAEESVEAEKLAWEEYSSGLTDITTVLDSIRRSITAQRSYIQVANQRIQSRIDLYLALGGGMEDGTRS